MGYEQKENRGALFRNDKKETDKHPHYKGNINVNGQDFWISAWVKEPKGGGEKYLSLSVQPKEDRNGGGPRQAQPQQNRSRGGFLG